MRIVFVTEYFSEGLGYIENRLTKAMAAVGHEVHVVTSQLNVNGNLPHYKEIYQDFLGPAIVPAGAFEVDGYTVHRLPYRLVRGYVCIRGLVRKVRALQPDITQVSAAASLNLFLLASAKGAFSGRLFSACHQCTSVVPPHLRTEHPSLHKLVYYMTRTLPGRLSAHVTDGCFAANQDCADVAHRYYGVPDDKLAVAAIGTDTETFSPATEESQRAAAKKIRAELKCSASDVLCIYTGRFSDAKNPLLLARAIGGLQESGKAYKGLFIGDGPQADRLAKERGCEIRPFQKNEQLADYYRAADIGVWPNQESMSMLDAAATGIPLIVNDQMGDRSRVEGNGLLYRQNDLADLRAKLLDLESPQIRARLGAAGVQKIRACFSWSQIAAQRLSAYQRALEGSDAVRRDSPPLPGSAEASVSARTAAADFPGDSANQRNGLRGCHHRAA